MLSYLAIFAFIFGSVVGSFLNVVILRYGKRPISGRSGCPFCGKELRWYELIPILSFVAQKGRCRSCGERISSQYLLVEVLTGFVFVWIFYFLIDLYQLSSLAEIEFIYFIPSFVLLAVIWSLLVVIFVYDLYHKIIPDRFVFPFIGASFIWLFHSVRPDEFLSIPEFSDLLMGLVLFLFFFSLWYFSKGEWMGFGDAKLALGMGFLLGFSKGFAAFMLSFWIGAAVAILLLLFRPALSESESFLIPQTLKDLSMKSEVPFAPFLITGTALAFFFGINTADLVTIFYF